MSANLQLSDHAPIAVLLVDDDQAVRSVVARGLERLGYAVVQCDSGEKALSIVQGDGILFDMVLCDTVLGGMNGDETARLIGEAQPTLAVISMSGYPRDTPTMADGGPPRFFIAKPFKTQVLSALIHQVLGHA